MLNGIPYRAAELVEKEINLGRIKKTKKTYELMAGSWHSARELDKAIMAYNVAAEIGKDPKIFVQVGRIHAEQEQWDEAIAAYEKALKLGNFKNTGEVQLAVGIAKFYSQDKTGAIASLKNALAQADTKSQAAKWLDFVNRH